MAEREAAELVTVDTSITTPATTEAQIAEPTDADKIAAAVRTATVGKEHAIRVEPSLGAALQQARSSRRPERGVPQNLSDADHRTHGSWD